MSPLQRMLLLLEVIVCYGPAFLLWGMGLIVIPISITSLASGQISGLYLLAMLAGGGLGMAALISLVIKIMGSDSQIMSPFKIKLFMASGVIAIIAFLFMANVGGFNLLSILLLLPIIASIHLIYLGRSYIFNKNC